jgi:hypothetical protein
MRAGGAVVGLFRGIAVAGVLLCAIRPAAAVDFSLSVFADGVHIGDADQTRMGCVDNPDGVSASCNAQDLDYGADYPLVQVDIGTASENFLISDPVVSGTIGITNLQATTQHLTFVFTLPVSSMPGGTVTGGRVSGTLTDANGDGASVYTNGPGTAFYTALLDGADWQKLYTDLSTFSASNGSTSIPQLQFGTPIPSLPGPPVAGSIGIRLDFNLTGFDNVSFTSNHVVVAPEPGTAALFGLGLAFLAIRRRSN